MQNSVVRTHHEITIASLNTKMSQRLRSLDDSLPYSLRLNYRLFCPNVSLVNKIRFGELGKILCLIHYLETRKEKI